MTKLTLTKELKRLILIRSLLSLGVVASKVAAATLPAAYAQHVAVFDTLLAVIWVWS